MRQSFACILFFVGCASLVFAQSQANTGNIEGTVYDPSGQFIPGATVSILNVGTNFERTLTTDEGGRFRGLLLPLGSYKVTATAPNFGKLIRQGIELAVGQTVNLTLNLGLANIEQTVNVTGDAPVIETSSVEESSYIDSNSIRSLPNNGRNFLDFVTLTPASRLCRGPMVTRSRSTARKVSTTTYPLMEVTTTIRSSANSAAGSGLLSR